MNTNLFQYEHICQMNESELSVYNYVSTHLKEASGMNIRELSKITKVSTTTILRFCSKIGCDGYTEFKYRLRKSLEENKLSQTQLSAVVPAIQYLQKTLNDPIQDKKLEKAAELCIHAKQILFIGIGTSGSLSEYGARFLSSVGVPAFSITDPFYPAPIADLQDMLLIALSVSGETKQMINLTAGYKAKNAKVISITNTDSCTVAQMSDLNFAYYMPLIYLSPESTWLNMTTQIPVCYLLETLAQKIYEKTGHIIPVKPQ